MASKVHHPREYWKKKVQEWLSSGKSASAWCSESQVPYSTFLSWRKRLEIPEESKGQSLAPLVSPLPQEYWEQKLQEWFLSGKSARAWCNEHQLPYRTFLFYVEKMP